MKWTKERPTKTGYYWYFDVADPQICFIDDGRVYFTGDEVSDDVEVLGGEWAGPIPEPED